MQPHNLSKIFNKFVGKEVSVTETVHTTKYGDIMSASLSDKNDPVIQGMEQEAVRNGLELRFWLPGTMGTADYCVDRVNVDISKESDGKYRIQNSFRIG